MASLDFSIDFSGWDRWSHAAAVRTQNLTPVHELIGDYMVEQCRNNFDSGGGAEGWKALSPTTLTSERLKYGHSPLLKTRELVRDIRKDATDAYVDIGSTLKQSRALFFGTDKMPARSPFAWRAGVLDRVGDMYLKYIVLGGL